MSYQKITLIGNLGRDPETRTLDSGTEVCSFSVATSRKWKNSNGDTQEETVWFRISAWGKLGGACQQYLSKGRKVCVVGRIQTPRIWTNQDGESATGLDVTAEDVVFLTGRGDSDDGGGSSNRSSGGGSSSSQSSGSSGGGHTDDYDDDYDDEDVPF